MASRILNRSTLLAASRSALQPSKALKPASIRLLSTYEKHKDTLEALGISKQNKGVFDGEWKGSGPVMQSVNPVNNEVIAEVTTVRHMNLEIPGPFPGPVLTHIGFYSTGISTRYGHSS
jgi:aldehyde dehydrogenase family 7 protein A1